MQKFFFTISLITAFVFLCGPSIVSASAASTTKVSVSTPVPSHWVLIRTWTVANIQYKEYQVSATDYFIIGVDIKP